MKKFEDIYKINVNDKVEKKGKFNYLSWAYAWAEIKKIDEKAKYTVYEYNNLPFIKSEEEGYFVKVGVTLNDVEHIVFLPVLDGANRPIQSPNVFNINTSIQRCLVKAIAMHGLGLYIYAGEDLPSEEAEVEKKSPNAQSYDNRITAGQLNFLLKISKQTPEELNKLTKQEANLLIKKLTDKAE